MIIADRDQHAGSRLEMLDHDLGSSCIDRFECRVLHEVHHAPDQSAVEAMEAAIFASDRPDSVRKRKAIVDPFEEQAVLFELTLAVSQRLQGMMRKAATARQVIQLAHQKDVERVGTAGEFDEALEVADLVCATAREMAEKNWRVLK